jgi:hypothetical protein
MDTASTTTRQSPVSHGAAAPRLAVVLDRPAGTRHADRVEAPDRVLRMRELLRTGDDELHRVTSPPEAAARLQQQLETVTTELERSVSPELAGELRHLTGTDGTAAPTSGTAHRIRQPARLDRCAGDRNAQPARNGSPSSPVSPDGRR